MEFDDIRKSYSCSVKIRPSLQIWLQCIPVTQEPLSIVLKSSVTIIVLFLISMQTEAQIHDEFLSIASLTRNFKALNNPQGGHSAFMHTKKFSGNPKISL